MPELAFLFDMDGVIVDSNPMHRVAWDQYNRRYGVETTEAMYRAMYGKRNDEIIRGYLGEDLTDAEVFEHGAAKERLYRELMAPNVRNSLVPGVRDFIGRHRDTPMAVATNGEKANADMALDGTGLAASFRAIVTGGDVVNPKPHPDIYLKAAEMLAVNPSRCIVFEDSYAGVEAGLAAGMRVVGIGTTHNELPGVALLIPDFNDPALELWLAGLARQFLSPAVCYTDVDTKREKREDKE